LFVLAKLFKINIKYFVAYKAVLNFWIVLLIGMVFVELLRVDIPFIQTIIFLILFIINLKVAKGFKKRTKDSRDDEKGNNIENMDEDNKITRKK